MDGLTCRARGTRAEMAMVDEHGGAVKAVPYMKTQLVESHRERVRLIESGDLKVVGQNIYTSTEPSPSQTGEDGGMLLTVDPNVERGPDRGRCRSGAHSRDKAAVDARLEPCGGRAATTPRTSCPPPSPPPRPAPRRASGRGAARRLRRVPRADRRPRMPRPPPTTRTLTELREKVERPRRTRPPSSRSWSASQASTAIRTAPSRSPCARATPGWTWSTGIRLTPVRDRANAGGEGVHVVGLSILSGSHHELIPNVMPTLNDAGVDVPVVVGDVIPSADEESTDRDEGPPASTRRRTRDQPNHGSHRPDLVAERHNVAAAA